MTIFHVFSKAGRTNFLIKTALRKYSLYPHVMLNNPRSYMSATLKQLIEMCVQGDQSLVAELLGLAWFEVRSVAAGAALQHPHSHALI